MSASPVAVIDIGSNTIKVLVAGYAGDGTLRTVASEATDARISAGISQANPRLTDESMQRGVSAIESLLAFAAPFAPSRTVLVATSAVRDAGNGAEFRARVQAATGHEIRILSGEEEANLIGRGLTCDPALSGLVDFDVFDLGGGSLECLAFRARRIRQALSLQLGCVRLTEKLIADPARPLTRDDLDAVIRHTAETLLTAEFAFLLPPPTIAIGTGGTLATVRAMLAGRAAREDLEGTDTLIEVTALRQLLADLAGKTLAERREVPGLPAARADVFPTALATLIAIAETGGITGFRHSLYNLRFGLAAELLESDA